MCFILYYVFFLQLNSTLEIVYILVHVAWHEFIIEWLDCLIECPTWKIKIKNPKLLVTLSSLLDSEYKVQELIKFLKEEYKYKEWFKNIRNKKWTVQSNIEEGSA